MLEQRVITTSTPLPLTCLPFLSHLGKKKQKKPKLFCFQFFSPIQLMNSCYSGFFFSPYRDQSASATYYFREKTEEEKAKENLPKRPASAQSNLMAEWMYYRVLQRGESEFPLRNKQVKRSSMILSIRSNAAVF